MPGHTWWNDLWLLEYSLPGPSQVPDAGNQGGPALEDVWPWCFWGGLLAAWLWKQGMGNTSWHTPSPVQPCKTRRTCHTWDLAWAPGPNDQPHHGILWVQPPYVQLEKPTGGGSPLIPLVWPVCTGHPFWVWDGFVLAHIDWLQGVCCLGLAFSQHFISQPSNN